MKKLLSLIKVSLNHDMNIFKINSKKQSKFSKIFLPLVLTLYMMFISAVYSGMLMEKLQPLHLEYVVLSLFALTISVLTFIEGVYKSGSLLFDTKDDNLLLSLPIKRRTVLFIRVFKFYVFELLFNSLFLIPAMFIYAINVSPGASYYLISLIALLILPIVPIALSCIVGFIVTYLASKFKWKNILQTILTIFFLLFVFYASYNMDGFISDIVAKASSISDIITKIYYPVGAYISMVENFNIGTLLIYIFINVAILACVIFALGMGYFKVNSSSKRVLVSHKNKNYVIKSNGKMKAFIRKELNRFFTTPVFIINSGFGLVLFIIICIMVALKFDSVIASLGETFQDFDINLITNNLPLFVVAIVAFSSFMTSITSSMISLEGKSINILKSLPIKPLEIALYKVIAALMIMLPCILIGDIIIFIAFKFDVISILLILVLSILFPLVSELIGIIVNLKYPKLDATNDTEVVKQSMSSFISVLAGIFLLTLTAILLFKLFGYGLSSIVIMLILVVLYAIITLALLVLLTKTCDKNFNNMNV